MRALWTGLALAACSWGKTEAVPTRTPMEQAVAVAKAVQADPAQADAALAEQGLTREAFEALLYEIAADPDKTEAYRAALRAQ